MVERLVKNLNELQAGYRAHRNIVDQKLLSELATKKQTYRNDDVESNCSNEIATTEENLNTSVHE